MIFTSFVLRIIWKQKYNWVFIFGTQIDESKGRLPTAHNVKMEITLYEVFSSKVPLKIEKELNIKNLLTLPF